MMSGTLRDRVRRREWLAQPRQLRAIYTVVIAIVLLAGAVVAEAQQEAKPVTIGVLSGAVSRMEARLVRGVPAGLRGLGWEEGGNPAEGRAPTETSRGCRPR